MPGFRWLGAIAGGLAAIILAAACGPLDRPAPTGTLLLLLSGSASGSASLGALAVRSGSGWRSVGSFSGRIPAAPGTATAASAALPAGSYSGVRAGGREIGVRFEVDAGQVEPVLIEVVDGRPAGGGAYAGTAAVNVGLQELDGTLPRLPPIQLTDQAGRPFSAADLAGHPALLADFHTSCHETCPLYTGLFLQLQRKLPASVRLVEVTTNPWQDTPAAMRAYGSRFGASWTFATAAPDALSRFWKPFGVQLSREDTHVSELALIDAHGYIVRRFQGVPDLGGSLAPALRAYLSDVGRAQLASHGDGWGLGQVLDAVQGVGARPLAPTPAPGGTRTPDFNLQGWNGSNYRPGSFAGRPLVINFWASWCVPCQAEMPLLQRAAAKEGPKGVAFLFVDTRDDAGAAHRFISQLGAPTGGVIASDPDGALADSFHLAALPDTVFIRSDGSVAAVKIGALDQRTLDAYLAGLDAG